MLGLQRLPQQGIGLKIDHAEGQVIARAPVGIDLVQFTGA